VKKGQVLIEFDLALIKAKAKSSITPVIITNSADLKEVKIEAKGGSISPLASLITVRR
jgi:phosphotransferase system IIA component